jgi:phosphatidylglycerophosphatase A
LERLPGGWGIMADDAAAGAAAGIVAHLIMFLT